MAHIVKQRYTVWTLGGRRCAPHTPGAAKETKVSKKWYGVGIPGQGARRVPLSAVAAVARRRLDDLVRAAELGAAGVPDARARARPLAALVGEFAADAALGLASRARGRRRKPAAGAVATLTARVGAAAAGCGWAAPADLGAAAPAALARWLDERIAAEEMSHQTANFYLAGVRRFVWWLAKRNLGVRPDLFDGVPGYDARNHRVHARREIRPEELAAVLAAARAGPPRRGLSGEDRYHLYLTACATGYRAAELARLVPEGFRLAADPPVVALGGRHAKNDRAAAQPVPPGVARQLAAWVAGKPPGRPVWPGKWAAHKEAGRALLRHDLAAAGVPYRVETPDGPRYADFHSLRHTFVSALAAAGATPKELQELARHSSPQLTLGVYAHARPGAAAAAVNRLALPGEAPAELTRDQVEALAAIGWAALTLLLTPGSRR